MDRSSEPPDAVEQGLPSEAPSLEELPRQHRERLRTMVALRMDRRVASRLDPSDVLQETYLEASRRFADNLREPGMGPYLWLRFLMIQRLLILHRRHLEAANRDAGREISLDVRALDVSSEGLAANGKPTSTADRKGRDSQHMTRTGH